MVGGDAAGNERWVISRKPTCREPINQKGFLTVNDLDDHAGVVRRQPKIKVGACNIS